MDQQPHWQDGDEFRSPLESAATRVVKTFRFTASALRVGLKFSIGNNFTCLIADDGVRIRSYDPETGAFSDPIRDRKILPQKKLHRETAADSSKFPGHSSVGPYLAGRAHDWLPFAPINDLFLSRVDC